MLACPLELQVLSQQPSVPIGGTLYINCARVKPMSEEIKSQIVGT